MYRCPVCTKQSKTKRTYNSPKGDVVRYRECPNCRTKFITKERISLRGFVRSLRKRLKE